MALRPLEAVHHLQHLSEFFKSIFPRTHDLHGELLLYMAEVVRNSFAVAHHSLILVFFEDAGVAFGRDVHHVFLDIVDVHVALAEHVAALVDITLDEEGHDELVEAADFVAREEALLIGHRLHPVGPLLLQPLNHRVLEGLPSHVGAFTASAGLITRS